MVERQIHRKGTAQQAKDFVEKARGRERGVLRKIQFRRDTSIEDKDTKNVSGVNCSILHENSRFSSLYCIICSRIDFMCLTDSKRSHICTTRRVESCNQQALIPQSFLKHRCSPCNHCALNTNALSLPRAHKCYLPSVVTYGSWLSGLDEYSP